MSLKMDVRPGHGIAAVLLLILGCSSEPMVVTHPMDPAQDQLLQIAAAYRQVNLDRGQPPQTPREIEPVLRSRDVSSNVFISPRDGEAFVIAWGAEMVRLPVDNRTQSIIAYEKSGKNGSRFVLMAEGNVMLLSNSEFKNATFAAEFGSAIPQ